MVARLPLSRSVGGQVTTSDTLSDINTQRCLQGKWWDYLHHSSCLGLGGAAELSLRWLLGITDLFVAAPANVL